MGITAESCERTQKGTRSLLRKQFHLVAVNQYAGPCDTYILFLLAVEHVTTKQFSDEYLLGLLRTVLKKNDATFTCPEQRDMIRHVLAGARNMVVILPTGSGKSMAWLIPAIIPSDKVSVVIVPYQSLLQDHIKEAKERQIRFHHWKADDKDIQQAKVVFVAMESVISKSFQE
jgi:superfamily II DNA helicase RecQ